MLFVAVREACGVKQAERASVSKDCSQLGREYLMGCNRAYQRSRVSVFVGLPPFPHWTCRHCDLCKHTPNQASSEWPCVNCQDMRCTLFCVQVCCRALGMVPSHMQRYRAYQLLGPAHACDRGCLADKSTAAQAVFDAPPSTPSTMGSCPIICLMSSILRQG